jgi:actin related protein 2/3 complex subunit 2
VCSERSDSLLLKIADFDNTSYRISTNAENKSILNISLSLRCWNELMNSYGAFDSLRQLFGDNLAATPENGFDVTITLDLDAVAADKAKTEFILKNVPQLKRHAMAAPFQKAFAAQANKTASSLFSVNYREGEAMYVQAQPDRVTVVFATQFKEEADRVYAKVFLQVLLSSDSILKLSKNLNELASA